MCPVPAITFGASASSAALKHGAPRTRAAIFTFQMLMDDLGLNGASHAENLAAVTAVDDYTVKFSL